MIPTVSSTLLYIRRSGVCHRHPCSLMCMVPALPGKVYSRHHLQDMRGRGQGCEGRGNSSSSRPPAYYKNNLSELTRHRSGWLKRQARPPGPCATFCATSIHAHLSRYYEYPPKKQTSSNMIKRENENLNPARLPIPPLARP